ncbi:hypothetical protein A7A08_03009 [Methyloligella halotolerans]|uniref:TNase-like domain-containing protein n=1 Tax=Methyloligella halotolerans TaxID=1177755 RepID=A0A1E2RV78_9HYPH|nr:hypothetical protein A7A08_03009 [Methyloligella halotolerans]
MGRVIRRDFRKKGRNTRPTVRRQRHGPRMSLQAVSLLLILIGLSAGAVWLMFSSRQIEIGHRGKSASITVLDGDTVETSEGVFRLVGFNTPEIHGDCSEERALARRARDRLRALVTAGSTNLRRVPCACPPGTEGTRSCNFGRFCGVLTVNGRRAGDILIGEGLAEPYFCRDRSCPSRRDWCGD